MLTEPQKLYFETFGFLLLPQLFSPQEMASITREADDQFRQVQDSNDVQDYEHADAFIESRDGLAWLADDDRIYPIMEQLLGAGFVWGGSEGNRDDASPPDDHIWHCDRWNQRDLDHRWIKTMLYLEPAKKDTGALRVMPGSHLKTFRLALGDLHQYERQDGHRPLGLPGEDLPCAALETQPGDLVMFDQYLFHSVFHKQPGRRYIAMKYVQKPTTRRHLEALRQHSQDSSRLHERFRNSDRPCICAMVENLIALEQTAT